MSVISRVLSRALPLYLVACASSPYPSVNDPMPPPDAASVSARAKASEQEPAAAVVGGTLQRADVERVVDAGLGRFLGHVVLEPSLSAGKFSGWSIVDVVPRGLWSGIDLRPGDVVTKINGMPIEREAQAFDAFQAVRQAPALEISYLRQNQPRTLRFAIVGAASPSLPKAAPTADSSVAPPPRR